VVTDSTGGQVNADAGNENAYNSEKAFHCKLCGVEDIHLATLGSLDSPRGVWHRLGEQYAAASRARIMQLRRNLVSCSISKYISLTEFVRELERCRMQLAAIGKTVFAEHYNSIYVAKLKFSAVEKANTEGVQTHIAEDNSRLAELIPTNALAGAGRGS
jgi:hypothetical protein